MLKTMEVNFLVLSFEGQVTFLNSVLTSRKYLVSFAIREVLYHKLAEMWRWRVMLPRLAKDESRGLQA